MEFMKKWAIFKKGILSRVHRRSPGFRDMTVILIVGVLVFALSATFDVFNRVIAWVYRHDTWQIDELFTVSLYLVLAFAIYAWRRHRELVIQTRRREHAESERARLIPELESALDDVSALKKLLPLCSYCRKVRDDRGYWSRVEEYVEIHFQARFDDGLCPECARKLYSSGQRMAGRGSGSEQ
jgi:uncharacterized membrane protein SirB2